MFASSVKVFAEKYKDDGVTEAEAWALATYTTSEYSQMNALGRGIDYSALYKLKPEHRDSNKQQENALYDFESRLRDYYKSLPDSGDKPKLPLANPPEEWELQKFKKDLDRYAGGQTEQTDYQHHAEEAIRRKKEIERLSEQHPSSEIEQQRVGLVESYNGYLNEHSLPDDPQRLLNITHQTPPILPPENRVDEQVTLTCSKDKIDEAIRQKKEIERMQGLDDGEAKQQLAALVDQYKRFVRDNNLPDDLGKLTKMSDGPMGPEGQVQHKIQRCDLAQMANAITNDAQKALDELLEMADGPLENADHLQESIQLARDELESRIAERDLFCRQHNLPAESDKLQQMVNIAVVIKAQTEGVANKETAVKNQLVNSLLKKVAKSNKNSGETLVVRRGMDVNQWSPKVREKWMSYGVGDEFVENGFMSTATAASPTFENGLVMIITLKPQVPKIGCAELSAYPSENEVLLPSATRFKVNAVRRDEEVEYSNGTKKIQHILEIEALAS
jgi:hypothetical protein